MKKIIRISIVLAISLFGFSTFASIGAKTLLETASESKVNIELIFDEAYANVYTDFQESIAPFLSTTNYQSLACLGVIDDTLLLKQIQNDYKNLKISFLNAYAVVYSDALDVEQKNRIFEDNGLFLFSNGTNYEIESARILKLFDNLVITQKNLASNFEETYKQKIADFVDDFDDYSSKNKAILDSVNSRIQLLEQVDLKYKELTSDLLDYQSKLAGSGAKFFSKLNLVKQSLVLYADISFQNIINKEVNRYKILKNLGDELSKQKTYALGLFEMQIDEKINLLLDKRYDNKEFSQIKKEVDQIVLNNYASGGKLNCSNFVSSDSFVQNTNALIKKIDSFAKSFSLDDDIVNSNPDFQSSVMNRFSLIVNLQKDIKKTFVSAVSQKKQSLLDEYKKSIDTSLNDVINIEVEQKSSISSSFNFTKPFKKGESNDDIKILQQLMIKLSYYNGPINGIYNNETLQSVYQYQLARGVLKGYENKPQVWGWMGPATRAQLNKDLHN